MLIDMLREINFKTGVKYEHKKKMVSILMYLIEVIRR